MCTSDSHRMGANGLRTAGAELVELSVGFQERKVQIPVNRCGPIWIESVAERVGFEPTVPCGTTVFETVPIDHSGTSPHRQVRRSGGSKAGPLT